MPDTRDHSTIYFAANQSHLCNRDEGHETMTPLTYRRVPRRYLVGRGHVPRRYLGRVKCSASNTAVWLDSKVCHSKLDRHIVN